MNLPTPCTTVVVLVFIQQNDKILLVKQAYGRRYWSLPGGKLEPGESIEQAAIREAKEETGLDIRLGRLVGLYSKPAANSLAICFEAEIVGGILRPANEILDCRHFPCDALPEPVREHLRQRVADFRRAYPHTVVRTQ